MEALAKILIYGDIHLSDRNYGSHKEYPKESLYYFKNITKVAEEIGATHIIGLGDFTYGRFRTLEYRKEVEDELDKQNSLTGGNRYELKGNHDSATYGMTEYEYYLSSKKLKSSINLSIGNLNLMMIDYNKHRTKEHKGLYVDETKTNIVLMHDFFKFSNTNIADYGQAYILDNFEPWYGVDYIIGGHIHNHEIFRGKISKDNKVEKETVVHYLGCPCRPSYREGHMQDTGQYVILTVYEDKVDYDIYEFDLWEIENSFNLGTIEEKVIKRVDVSDIVHQLDTHQRVIGEPEEVINAMIDIDITVKNKAISLLHTAQQ